MSNQKPRSWKFPNLGCNICQLLARKRRAAHAVIEGTATEQEVDLLVTNTPGPGGSGQEVTNTPGPERKGEKVINTVGKRMTSTDLTKTVGEGKKISTLDHFNGLADAVDDYMIEKEETRNYDAHD